MALPALLFALLPQATAAESWPAVEVASAGGRYVATVAKAAGQERVRDALARWRVTVRAASPGGGGELRWEAPIDHGAEPRRYALSSDGGTFARVLDRVPSRAPLVRVLRRGGEVAALDGEALGLGRAATRPGGGDGTWLAAGEDAVALEWRETDLGVWLALVLRPRYGLPVAVDAGVGALAEEPPAAAPTVRPRPPAASKLALQDAFVSAVRAPSHALAGEPLEVEVEGSFPTPNWNLMGFALEPAAPHREGDAPEAADGPARTLRLRPRIAPPDGPQLTVLQGFQSTAVVDGLSVGRWSFVALGRDDRRVGPAFVEVLPQRLRVELALTGGPAGTERRARLFVPGVVAREGSAIDDGRRFELLSDEALGRIEGLLAELPGRRAPGAAGGAAIELGWWRDGRWWDLSAGEPSAPPALQAIVAEILGEG